MLEVVVAMVIFVLLLFLVLTIFFRLSTSGFTAKKLKYDMLAVYHAYTSKKAQNFLDETVELEGALLVKKVHSLQKKLLLFRIDIITTEGDTLVQYKELIYEPNQNRSIYAY